MVSTDGTSVRRGVTWFISSDQQPRTRRAADVFTVVIGMFLAGIGAYGVSRESSIERAIDEILTGDPEWLTTLSELMFTFGLIYGIILVVAIVRGGSTRRTALRDVVLSVALAVVLTMVMSWWINGEWPYVLPEIGLEDAAPRFPVLRVVVVTAGLIAASPYVALPIRRLGWLTIILIAGAAVVLSYGDPSDAIGAVGIGMVAGAGTLLIFGSPKGYPDPHSIGAALTDMGIPVEDVSIDEHQTWGARRLTATTPDGRTLAVKAYGRDASDSMRAAKAWRTLWYREEGRTVSYSRLQAVEHEGLVSMIASRTGATVAPVIAAGQASGEVALYVEPGGLPLLTSLDAEDISDDLLVALWADVGRLHAAGISHGSLSTNAVAYDGSHHIIREFSRGSVVADQSDRANDVVMLMYSLSAQVGVDRGVDSAIAGLGVDAIAEALPYLQLPAIDRTTKKQADDPKELVNSLKTTISEQTEIELPEPVKLRRVTGRDLATALLLLFALGALIPMIAGIDFAEVWSVLENATWGLIAVAFVVGETMFIPQAMGMMYAVGGNLPFWPLVTLQVAIMFIGLAVPSAAGRVAMNSAFLHKFGFGVTVSITQGAMDSFAGFFVEASILVLALLSGNYDLGLEFESEDVSWGIVILVVILIALVVVALFRRVERLRERVLPEIQKGWSALVAILRTPSRALGLIGSNLATRLVMAAALWLVLIAIDAPLNYGGALVAVVATNLLQGLVPVPGGIGVSETVMTGFLVALGIDENSAFAATITWRMITFYIPSAAGFFASKWLERHEYL